MMTYQVELVDLQAQPAAVVRGYQVMESEIPAFLGASFAEVLGILADQGLAPAGHPFARYALADGGFDVEAGFPATRPVRPAGRVDGCELPGGQAARVLHQGSYSGVAAAYQAVSEWVSAYGYVAAEPPWECYLDGPEVAEPRTEIYLPCRRPT
jgi:effector-binding domain-containing protein